ncbi:MAG: hypothetical protein NW223_03060 [Hyphomicrobiaceae bacterium]|nr:hypothetical protein [Hyphomicrobiaceae bacterium]
MTRSLVLGLIVLVHGLAGVLAQTPKPPVPPGWDSGGTLVALIGSGIDYRQPTIAARLARDGEGEVIGWDCVEDDRRPFDRSQGGSPDAAGGDTTAIASVILAGKEPVRLVAVRADVANARTLGNAAFFAGKTGARVVALAMWSDNGGAWETFRQAVALNGNVLFIVAAGDGPDAEALYPAAFNLSNMLVVSAGEGWQRAKGFNGITRNVAGGQLGAALAVQAAARILGREPTIAVADLKARLEKELVTPRKKAIGKAP